MDHSDSSRDKSKTPEHALAGRLETECGLNPAQVRLALDIFADHLQSYHSDARAPGVIVHTAVSKQEPAGKPIKDCTVVPVKLTTVHDADLQVMKEEGPVELRKVRLARFCDEAHSQRGLLSHEDLHFLLCVDISTIGDYVAELRREGVCVPTRGAVKDIGPEPTHKRVIAQYLARGFSTSRIRAMTKHSEGAIGRYQQQFGLVLYLLKTFPDASDEERRQLADLSEKSYRTYVDVYEEASKEPSCQPHLERLRRRYELDPEGIAMKVPSGKAPQDFSARRLEQQTLETAVRQTIQEDLATTKRVAQTVAGDVMDLVESAYRLPDGLRPGEAVAFVDAHDPSWLSGQRVSDRKVIPVKVPLYTEEMQAIWRSDEPIGRRRASIAAHIATATQEQGGVMSIAKLAELLHVNDTTIGKDLRDLAVACHVEAPIKGVIEDAGPTLTHKDWIVDLDQCGLTGEQISWLTRHAPPSRDRYITTYRRAELLMRLEGRIPEPGHLGRVLNVRRPVAKQYIDLLHRYHGDGKPLPAFDSTLASQHAPLEPGPAPAEVSR